MLWCALEGGASVLGLGRRKGRGSGALWKNQFYCLEKNSFFKKRKEKELSANGGIQTPPQQLSRRRRFPTRPSSTRPQRRRGAQPGLHTKRDGEQAGRRASSLIPPHSLASMPNSHMFALEYLFDKMLTAFSARCFFFLIPLTA